jgi:Ca-activated chloride channel family protein
MRREFLLSVWGVGLLLASCASRPIPEESGGDLESLPETEALAPPASFDDTAGTPAAGAPAAAAPSGGALMEEEALELGAVAPASEAPAADTPAAAKQTAEERARPSQVRYLSADDSNSAASPVIVRQLIREGKYVPAEVVRTYEFLNYYSFAYPPPEEADIGITAEMRETEEQGEYSLQVAVRSRDRSLGELKPLNVTFLVDVSGSMAGTPQQLSRLFLLEFAEKLRNGDRISIVAFNRETETLLDSHEVTPATVSFLKEEIVHRLMPNDVTDMDRGIDAAYRLAGRNYDGSYLNRVIVLSDGAANAGDLALETISSHAQDADRQGIYLAGIGFGQGFNDVLMNRLTDRGRGAYLFADGEAEVMRILSDNHFVANFDLAVKDVRLRMEMPSGWQMVEFHGEQVSERAADVIPQYLSPNDQMIYHLVMKNVGGEESDVFSFEVEYAPLLGAGRKVSYEVSVSQMLAGRSGLDKGDAIVAYAESLKKIAYPLAQNRSSNLAAFQKALRIVEETRDRLGDEELAEVADLLKRYGATLSEGESFPESRDREDDSVGAILGISANDIRSFGINSPRQELAVTSLSRLRRSTRLVPQEGYKFLAMSSGPVGNPAPAGSGQLAASPYPDPLPEYMGRQRTASDGRDVYDLSQITLVLRAPAGTRSFSFDFNFFSAEYPEYVNQNYNDSFYAILEAGSTNNGSPTNISFDSNGRPIEVDSNYFQNPFHPIPNRGTGFDHHGSTGWLRTSWPIRGGEQFSLTFSIHDEGDAVFDSLVVLDNFRWNNFDAVGTTDPLN